MSLGSSASRLRILLFLHSFGPGGVERVALRLAGAWAGAGHDVRMVMGRNDGAERSIAPDNVIYDFAPPHWSARRFESLWMVRQLVAGVRKHRPDVIFCAGNTYTIVAGLARAILGSECPPIVCKLSNSLDRRDLPAIARLGYWIWLRQHQHFIEQFVGLSEPMGKEIERFLGVRPERIAIIPNPVLTSSDMEELSGSRESGNGDGRRFVSVGRLTRQKNFPVLLRAFARIAKADDRLLIVGDGPERNRLAKLAAKLGISASVELPGHQSSVSKLLKAADVFVSSSNYEGLPGAVVEALAAGVPVVATHSSACLSHLLDDGELGQLVPIRDVAALAKALERAAVQEAPPLPTMRSAALAYMIERSAPLYLDVLAAAASGEPRTTRWTEFEPLAEAA